MRFQNNLKSVGVDSHFVKFSPINMQSTSSVSKNKLILEKTCDTIDDESFGNLLIMNIFKSDEGEDEALI